jgi:single-strand DNA-binding protein
MKKAGFMNHILIAGHLGNDPEVRFTSSGQKVTTLRVASHVRKAGKEDTIWWRVTVWGDQFDKILPYFKKGSPIIVTGELAKPEIFTDKEGRPQISLNITANNITFSPFGGKTEGRNEEGVATTKQAFSQRPELGQGSHSFADSGTFQPSHTAYGQKDSSEFHDEEIPF